MKKILFVEDDALIARIYSQKLAEKGFDVAVAADGLEAMRQLPQFRPDLVVLDLLMPRMTGADVLKFIREHPDLKTVRVIVFSNSFLSHLVEQVASLGVEATLVKAAVTPAQLIDAINTALGNPEHAPTPAEQRAAPAPATAKTKSAPPTGSGPPPVAPEAEPPVPKESDSHFVARIGQEFLERVPTVFQELRQLCRDFLAAAKTPQETCCLLALNRKLGFLTQLTALAGHHRTAELSSALEALLFELIRQPEAITDSSRQTITRTVAFLTDRFDRREYLDEKDHAPMSLLVIDDDAVSNLAIVQSLGRSKIPATSVTDPSQALERLRQSPYDAILLDVSLPGISGLDLCEQVRQLPLHQRTPVIFVTGHADFNTYAQSILSGGNDLITKPVSPNELCVKVITHLLKPR